NLFIINLFIIKEGVIPPLTIFKTPKLIYYSKQLNKGNSNKIEINITIKSSNTNLKILLPNTPKYLSPIAPISIDFFIHINKETLPPIIIIIKVYN
ncbi:hypothetical protein OFC47_25725, partial [Escherichia coli]|nr:hypothetical protein [Escherichia coli]